MKIQKKQEIEFFGTKTGNANSIALGYATETKNFGEVAVGVMNKSTAAKDPNSPKGVCADSDATLFSVGCGGSGERKNALEVKGDGSVIIPGENGNINIADKIKQAFDTDASIELVKSAEDSLQYTLMVNNEARGSINIPKDQFLKNVTYDSEGKQLVFTFVTLDEDEHVEKVPVGDLKDIYTAGNGINIDNNVISADFSSVEAAISDEKTQRETTDNEIKSILDTNIKSDEIYQCIKKEYDSSKRGANSIAIDDSAIASGKVATAIGNNAQANGFGATALGSHALATGDYSIAIGGEATGDYSIELGIGGSTSTVSKYALSGTDGNKKEIFNLEEITYSQYGNKKYIIGLGGYDGTNLTINNEAGEEVLNHNIKSVQEVINEKADASAIPIKLSQLTNDSFPTPNDIAIFAGLTIHNNAKIRYIQKSGGSEGTYLTAEIPADRVANKLFAADGSLFDVSKLVKTIDCKVSGDWHNIEFGYTNADNERSFILVPNVTKLSPGIMTAADKVKLDKLQELVELKIVGTSESSVAMKPNKVYEITVGSALTITLEEPTDKTVYNEYQGTFDTGDTIPTVTFPSNVRWNYTPKVGANQHVEFSIRYSGGKYYGICQVWDMTKQQSV